MRPAALRALLICVVLGVQVATVLGLMLGVQRQVTSRFADNAHLAITQLASSFSDSARAFLDPVEDAVELAGTLVEQGALGADDSRALETHLLAQLRVRPSLKSLTLGRADGSYVAAYRDGDALRVVGASAPGPGRTVREVRYGGGGHPGRDAGGGARSYDPRERPWYRAGVSSPELVWTGSFPLRGSDTLAIAAVRRIEDADGGLPGVIGASVEIAELSSLIASVPRVPGGTAVLFDRDRHVLAFSDYARMRSAPRSGPDGRELPYLEDVVGRPLQVMTERLEANRGPGAATGDDFLALQVDGAEHVGIARPLTLSSGAVDWTLYVQAPVEALWGSVEKLFDDSILLMLALVSLSTLLAVGTVVRLTAPVYDLHRTATVDALTGALIRAEFHGRLDALLRPRSDEPSSVRVAVLAFDLDGFKQVNDSHGHAAGDAVLVEFVARIRTRLREGDLVGRVGGDEFVAALRLTGDGDALRVARRLRDGIVAERFGEPPTRHRIGVTAGLAVVGPHERGRDALERADRALVAGKRLEKNRCYPAPGTPARTGDRGPAPGSPGSSRATGTATTSPV